MWIRIVFVMAFALLAHANVAVAGEPRGGVFSLINVDQVPESLPELDNPDVAGVSVRFSWESIEPRPGEMNWSAIDRVIKLAKSRNKKVMIRVVAGVRTPKWVYNAGAQTAEPEINVSEVNRLQSSSLWTQERARMLRKASKAPVVWDPVYLKHWLTFIRKFGARYDRNPVIYSIQMTGGGLAGEMALRPEYHWERFGYSDQRIKNTWTVIIDAYRKAFPHTPTNLDILEPIRGQSHVAQPVVDYCLEKYPRKVYLQYNGLNAQGGEKIFREILQKAVNKTVIGYQMTGGRAWNDKLVGDRWTAFQLALADKASYVEVYRADVVDPSTANAIKALAAGLAVKDIEQTR
jgi:hypothetical protein